MSATEDSATEVPGGSGDTAAVIPARDEADRVAETVTAAAQLPGVDLVIVVDDGSRDGTRAAAEQAASPGAGVSVVRHSRGCGKAAALETGAEVVRVLERHQRRTAPRHLLFLDADLAASAGRAGPLIEPVRNQAADMTIAVFTNRVRLGGHGLVVGFAGAGIQRATGWRPAQPLNGQRCLTREAFEVARPLARGFGAETGLTIDLLRRGLRVTEVEVDLAHRATGTDWRSQLHRARQLADVAAALAVRQALTRPPVAQPAAATAAVPSVPGPSASGPVPPDGQ
jgi:Glycosyl transferase family 2